MTIHTTRSTTQTRTTDTWTTDTETTTETTETTTTTTRTRKALAAAHEPEPKHPAAPAQEVDPPPQVAPAQPETVKPAAPLAPKSPWADQNHDRGNDQDHDDQDPAPQTSPPHDPADAATYEDFEGVRIRVGAARPRAGYVHWRNRRHVLGAALEVGVPAEVIHHAELMTQNQKPTTLGWKRAEKLIVQVKEAQDAGRDPAPLWKQWMPAGPAPELMPAPKPKEKSPAACSARSCPPIPAHRDRPFHGIVTGHSSAS